MATDFADFLREIEVTARVDGREAVEQLHAFREHFRVGRKLTRARIEKKLTQEQVAARAHLNQAEIAKIECGLANPTFNKLSDVASALDYEIDVKPRRFMKR